ncbi:MAG: hypothetical protein HRT52_17210 [Colwellia sp.]|nr:hypothetical protein [Colwellia sp.]
MSIQWVAHRGECQSHIENTLTSINEAIKNGITNIEIDIQLSRDGVAVLFHDRNLRRLCKQNKAIAELDLNAIQQLTLIPDDETHFKRKTAKIPTLCDVVSLIEKHPQITLFVEIKRVNFLHFSYQNVYKKIIHVLKPILTQVVLLSFSYRFLRLCRKYSRQTIAYVLPSWQQFNAKMLTKLQPEYIFCNIKRTPKEYIFDNSTFNWVLYEISNTIEAKDFNNRGVQYLESFTTKKLQQKLYV